MTEFPRGLAVVINVGTDYAAAVALASVREHAPRLRLRLLNCDPTGESRRLFAALAERLSFEVVEQPVRTHGQTLDQLFSDVDAEIVLLLDSDAEVLDSAAVTRSWASFEHSLVFGAGWVEGPDWMGPNVGATSTEGAAYFQERPYLPFVMLRASMIRDALAAGRSFKGRKVWNDVSFSPRLSLLLAARFQDDFVPRSSKVASLPEPVRARIRTWRFDALRWLRRDFHGHRPNYVVYDTGAEIYEWCKYERGLIFAGVDWRLCTEVEHHAGLTRGLLGDPYQVAEFGAVESTSRRRLAERYGIDLTGDEGASSRWRRDATE
jgi:hypothetical protein